MKIAKFIQILSHNGEVWALDAEGTVWRRDRGTGVWMRQTQIRK